MIKTSKFLALMAVTAFVFAQPVSTLAQPKPVPVKSTPGGDPFARKIKELNCDGLPLGEVMKMLEEQFPEINFVATPEARDAVVPKLTLHSVNLENILDAIQIASHGLIRGMQHNATMVAFEFNPDSVAPAPAKPAKVCRAFNLSHYLSNRSDKELAEAIDNIYRALETCWHLLDQANQSKFEPPQISLHRETKLLIAVGEPAQLAVVEQVVTEIERGSDKSGPVSKPTTTRLFSIKHAEPMALSSSLMRFASPDSKIMADPRTSQIIVTGTEQDMNTILRLIQELDVPTEKKSSQSAPQPAQQPTLPSPAPPPPSR